MKTEVLIALVMLAVLSISSNAQEKGKRFGFRLVGSIDINLGSNWSITPGLKFNSL